MFFEFTNEVLDHFLQWVGNSQPPLGLGTIVVDPQRSQFAQEFHDDWVGLKSESGSRNSILNGSNKLKC